MKIQKMAIFLALFNDQTPEKYLNPSGIRSYKLPKEYGEQVSDCKNIY
jgi:hypothetical protein